MKRDAVLVVLAVLVIDLASEWVLRSKKQRGVVGAAMIAGAAAKNYC